MTVREFLQRFDNHESFDNDELQDIFYGDFDIDDIIVEEVEHEYGSFQRWTHMESYTYQIGNRYFKSYAEIGNTEYQENYFDEQPIEVKPVIKTVEIVEYEEI